MSGGGTGGHITPILAVAEELKRLSPDCQVIYVGERAGRFADLVKDNPLIDETYAIYAGRFRRYHNESWLKRLVDVKTNMLNVRDFVYFLIGRVQAGRLISRIKPDVVFLKGGFVGVPVGLAAGRRGICIVTHDSDVLPGLANRIVSRFVDTHATALPVEYYPYPPNKVLQVGVLVERAFEHVVPEAQRRFKNQISIDENSPTLLITGGSLGAARINMAAVHIMDRLLNDFPLLVVIHQVGRGNADAYKGYVHNRLRVLEFLSPMYVFMGAADLVVCRASGNTLAELGVQGKACITVPNPRLAGGHQLKNAERLAREQAAVVIHESELDADPDKLLTAVEDLLRDSDKRFQLATRLQALEIPDAASRIAQLLLDKAKHVPQQKD